ncbi:hypothetical protein VR45_34965, partial [Streptomyces sp. NRRL S-495]
CTLIAWLAEERFPNPVNLAKIDNAYQDYRRRNVVKALTARLEANGGTRIEINPVDQSHVRPGRERDLQVRHVNVRQWEEIVEAWAEGDLDTLDEWWDEIIQDLGSDYDAYSHVSSLGFSA